MKSWEGELSAGLKHCPQQLQLLVDLWIKTAFWFNTILNMKSLIKALMTITSPSAMTPQLEKQSSLDVSIIIWKNSNSKRTRVKVLIIFKYWKYFQIHKHAARVHYLLLFHVSAMSLCGSISPSVTGGARLLFGSGIKLSVSSSKCSLYFCCSVSLIKQIC